MGGAEKGPKEGGGNKFQPEETIRVRLFKTKLGRERVGRELQALYGKLFSHQEINITRVNP